MKAHKKRWFLLKGQLLFHFKHKPHTKKSPPLGVWLMLDACCKLTFVPSPIKGQFYDRLALHSAKSTHTLHLLMPNRGDDYLSSWHRSLVACTKSRAVIAKLQLQNAQQRQMIQDLSLHLQETLGMIESTPPAPAEILSLPPVLPGSTHADAQVTAKETVPSLAASTRRNAETEKIQTSLRGLVSQMKIMFDSQIMADEPLSQSRHRSNTTRSSDAPSIASSVRSNSRTFLNLNYRRRAMRRG